MGKRDDGRTMRRAMRRLASMGWADLECSRLPDGTAVASAYGPDGAESIAYGRTREDATTTLIRRVAR